MKRSAFAIAVPAAVFIGGFLLYASTLAPSVVFGDPTEYTLVPHVWGILHPPGYAFMTLLARAWQTLVPLGSVAFRTNLLSATAAAGIGVLICGIVNSLLSNYQSPISNKRYPTPTNAAALFAAAVLLAAPDFWQHAIHANAHVVTAALITGSLFLLLRWRFTRQDRWLLGFGLAAGLGVTQHPLTAFGFPAYAAFVLLTRPRILREWRTLIALASAGLLGLAPWLYFPLRASISPPPPFGPHDMNTLDGFLNLALARGLRVNLFAFGWADQWQRLAVFWSLLRLQYALPVVALAGLGLVWLWKRDWRSGSLLTLYLATNLAFTLNTVQDVMAYLLAPFVVIAICAGVGADGILHIADSIVRRFSHHASRITHHAFRIALLLALFIWPALTLARNYARISLRSYRAADAFVDSVFEHFAGKGRNAALLLDWEHVTPLWYREYIEGQTLDPRDVTPVYVVGSSPTLWVDRIWENIEAGPIYLLEYRRDVVEAGFRLRAEGPFYRVMPPPAVEAPELTSRIAERAGPLEWLGYEVQAPGPLRPGARVPVLLAFRAPQAVADVVQPYATLGPYTFRWTTDSHWLTPWWQAGEIIVERWEVVLPLDAAPGEYRLSIGLSNLTTGEDLPWRSGSPLREIAALSVASAEGANVPALELRANFGQRVGLRAARAWSRDWRAEAPWDEPRPVRPGEAINIRLDWLSLATPEDSLTVFVHLLDSGDGLWASRDFTPLGGSFPTLLWFPKWLPGQQVTDPYRIFVPRDAPPGGYYLEVGLYGLRSIVRVPNFDRRGNLAGDRFVLGAITVLPPQ